MTIFFCLIWHALARSFRSLSRLAWLHNWIFVRRKCVSIYAYSIQIIFKEEKKIDDDIGKADREKYTIITVANGKFMLGMYHHHHSQFLCYPSFFSEEIAKVGFPPLLSIHTWQRVYIKICKFLHKKGGNTFKCTRRRKTHNCIILCRSAHFFSSNFAEKFPGILFLVEWTRPTFPSFRETLIFPHSQSILGGNTCHTCEAFVYLFTDFLKKKSHYIFSCLFLAPFSFRK